MASGHAYRTNRPNTWLLRPSCKVKILLANQEPSTHGPSRHIALPPEVGRYRAKQTCFSRITPPGLWAHGLGDLSP